MLKSLHTHPRTGVLLDRLVSHWEGAPRDPRVGQAEFPSPGRGRETCRDFRHCRSPPPFTTTPPSVGKTLVNHQICHLTYTQKIRRRLCFALRGCSPFFSKGQQRRRCGSSATPLRLRCSNRDRLPLFGSAGAPQVTRSHRNQQLSIPAGS